MVNEKLKTSKRKNKKMTEGEAYLSSLMKDDDAGDIISHRERGERGKFQRKSVAAGFKEDAAKILKEFTDHQGLDFSHFGKIWRHGNYALLYMGRENERELCETAYEMFTITLSFVTDPKQDLNTKIGAIYLLYCLYEKQPFPRYKVKIRILHEDWLAMKKVFDIVKDSHVNDCVLIIVKLIYDDAFHFAGSRFLMGPESSDYRNHPDKMEPVVLPSTWTDEIKEVFDEDSLQKHKDVQDEMEKHAAELGIINLFQNSDTVDKMLRFGKLAIKGDKTVFDLLDDDAEDVKPDIDTDIGNRRSKLKHQQLRAKCASPLSRRRRGKHLAVAVVNEDDDVDIDEPILLDEIEHSIKVEDVEQEIKEKIEDEIQESEVEEESEVEYGGLVEIKKEIESEDECVDAKNFKKHEKHLLELGLVVEKSLKSPLKKRKLLKVSRKSSKVRSGRKGQLHADDANALMLESKLAKKKRKRISKTTETKKSGETSSKPKAKKDPKSAVSDASKLPAKAKKSSKKISVIPKRFVRKKTSWRKARIIGRTRPEKKIMKGKKIKYYDDSEEEA